MIRAGTLAAHVSEPAPVTLPLTDTRKQGMKVNVCWELGSTQAAANFAGKSFLSLCRANGNTQLQLSCSPSQRCLGVPF